MAWAVAIQSLSRPWFPSTPSLVTDRRSTPIRTVSSLTDLAATRIAGRTT